MVAAHDDGNGTGPDDAADGALDAHKGVFPVALQHIGIAAVCNGDGVGQHLLVGLIIVIAGGAAAILGRSLTDAARAHTGTAQKANAHIKGDTQNTKVGSEFIQIQTDGVTAKGTDTGNRLADQFRTHNFLLLFKLNIWKMVNIAICISSLRLNYIISAKKRNNFRKP